MIGTVPVSSAFVGHMLGQQGYDCEIAFKDARSPEYIRAVTSHRASQNVGFGGHFQHVCYLLRRDMQRACSTDLQMEKISLSEC